jgi:hypothetical protein
MLDHLGESVPESHAMPSHSPAYSKTVHWVDERVRELMRDMPVGYRPPAFGSLEWWRLMLTDKRDDLALAAVYLAALGWLAEGEALPENLRLQLARERAAYQEGYDDGWNFWESQPAPSLHKKQNLRILK